MNSDNLSSMQISDLSKSINIQDVFKHYDIDLISDSDNRLKCLCPFHPENHASCMIYPDTNSWYSFCCKNGTDAFELIRLLEPDLDSAFEVLLKFTGPCEQTVFDEVLRQLKYETRSDTSDRIYDIQYMLGVFLRDWLIERKLEKSIYIDKAYQKMDEFFTAPRTLEEAQKFYDHIMTKIRSL